MEAQNHSEATKQDWKDKVDALLTDYDIKIVDASFHGVDVTNKSQHVTNTTQQLQDWDFWNSLLFCGTVYTTIGILVIPSFILPNKMTLNPNPKTPKDQNPTLTP